MPLITLTLSNNVDIKKLELQATFASIHQALCTIANVDNIQSCNSGVVQEAYSYNGDNNQQTTKVYLKISWLENSQRALLKKDLATACKNILAQDLLPQLATQNLTCKVYVHIANLGIKEQDFFIIKES